VDSEKGRKMRIGLRKKKQKPLDEKTITAIMQRQLEIQREKYEQFFKDLESNKEKQRIWNSLSNRDKIRILKNLERGKHEK
jgi:hypothetical protein